MRKILLGLLTATLLLPSAAWAAACSVTSIGVKDQGGTVQTFCVGGSAGQLLNQTQIVDSTGANIAAVNSSGQFAISNTAFTANLALGGTPLDASHPAPVYAPGNAAGTPDYVAPGTSAIFEVSPTTAANSTSNPFYVTPATGANFAGASPMQATGGTVGLVAGSAIVGKMGIDQTTPGTTNAIQNIAGTTGGATPYHFVSTASTNSQNIKATGGTLYSLSAINTTATIAYLRMYNVATSGPTCSSATGASHSYPVPPQTAAGGAGGFAIPIGSVGEAYSSGIGFCITGGGGDTDNTNAVAGVYVNASYK